MHLLFPRLFKFWLLLLGFFFQYIQWAIFLKKKTKMSKAASCSGTHWLLCLNVALFEKDWGWVIDGISRQLLLPCHACLLGAILPTMKVMDSHPLQQGGPN